MECVSLEEPETTLRLAYESAMIQSLKDAFKCLFKENLMKGDYSFIPNSEDIPEKYLVYLKEYSNRFNKPRNIFITINPKEEYLLFDKYNKFIKKKWVNTITQSYEWRNDDTGLHTHFLLKRGKKRPAECIREIKNHFRNICGNDKHIHVRMIKDKDVEKVIKYIHKNKENDIKQRNILAIKSLEYKKEYERYTLG